MLWALSIATPIGRRKRATSPTPSVVSPSPLQVPADPMSVVTAPLVKFTCRSAQL
jgi:hypothetical protein